MPDQLQLRGGTTAETNAFTGAAREVTVDTTKKTAVVHDGSTAGGNPLLREDGSNSALALGSQGTPSLKFTGDPNTGIFSPGADQVAVSTGGTERVEWGTSEVVFNDGGNNYDFRVEGDTNANLLFVDASTDRIGIGTSSPSTRLHVNSSDASATYLRVENTGGYALFGVDGSGNSYAGAESNDAFGLVTNGSYRMYITAGGNVGIGTTSVQAKFHVSNGGAQGLETDWDGSSFWYLQAYNRSTSSYIPLQINGSDLRLGINGSEKARLDSSGRLLVGTSSSVPVLSASTGAAVQVNSNNHGAYAQTWFYGANNQSGAAIMLAKSRNTTYGSYTAVQSGDSLGGLYWAGDDGSDLNNQAASILCWVDGTPGTDDMPGRLVFSTTADSASSPTERMRITNSGLISNKGNDPNNIGNLAGPGWTFSQQGDGYIIITRNGSQPLYINRLSSDGDLVGFYQDGSTEGTISVSGTTVSYNGAHLARWSQLPGGVERTEILRGSVLSNIDEMCEWVDAPKDAVLDDEGNEVEPATAGGPQANEQLNRMKVSDVEGDKNVAGVFQAWDDEDEIFTNDFYCAMTGDFVIRIAQGVTVERGDLLMSAGDGTAKPQDDDIIRSKTIAKVTSTNVSCTYDDGSYCVPCVLMAC